MNQFFFKNSTMDGVIESVQKYGAALGFKVQPCNPEFGDRKYIEGRVCYFEKKICASDSIPDRDRWLFGVAILELESDGSIKLQTATNYVPSGSYDFSHVDVDPRLVEEMHHAITAAHTHRKLYDQQLFK